MQQNIYIYSLRGENCADFRWGIPEPNDMLVQDALAATPAQFSVKRIQ
jgi:hypothetical protein